MESKHKIYISHNVLKCLNTLHCVYDDDIKIYEKIVVANEHEWGSRRVASQVEKERFENCEKK